MKHFFTDTTTATLQVVGDSVSGNATAEDADTVHLDSPWNDFFDTDEYVRFRATVAQDIVQPYFYDGEVKYFAKDEAELREAQPQIQHLPWTMGHPEDDRVTDSSEIRGFWDSPEYDDGQHAEVFIPADDTDAVRFAIQNDEVSIGFSGTLDWVEDPDSDTPSLTTDGGDTVYADAVQRNMAYDHIASVEQGRCPPEKGCGLHTDEARDASDPAEGGDARRCGLHTDSVGSHGHARVVDSEHDISASYDEGASSASGTVSDAELSAKFSEGDWLSWEWSGGEATGRVETVSTSEPLSVNGGETVRDPTEEGEPVYKLKHWDGGSFGNMKVAYESNLSATTSPKSSLPTNQSDSSTSASEPEGFSAQDGYHHASDSVRTTRTEEGGVVYQHDESYPYEDDSHRYESRDAAREAAAELGCDGAHKHEGPDGETWYMPCGSMDTFDRVTDAEHAYMDSCGCPHVTASLCEAASRSDSPQENRKVTTYADMGRTCSNGPCRCGLHTFGDAEINGTTVDLSVPDGAQSAAEAFLQAKEDGLIGSDCGTGAGTTSAEMIAEGEVTADRLTSKIHPYLQRADEYITRDEHPNQWPDEAWQDCGDAQYASWGWTNLRDWAESKVAEIEKAMAGNNTDSLTDAESASDHETWIASDESIEGVISYDGLADGQLDEAVLPNEGYEDHYVFAADTKSDSSYPLVDADGNLRRGNVAAAWEVYGHADDETLLLSVLAQANDRFASADGYSAPIDEESLMAAMESNDGETDGHHMEDHRFTTDSVSNPLQTYMSDGDNGGDGGSMPSDPTAFYDGEPTIEQLADDFGTVQMLLDDKEDLEGEVETLTDELRERKRGEAEQKAAELAEMTTVWGDEDELVEQFEDGEISLDDLDEKIKAAEDIATSTTTTATDSSAGGSEETDSGMVADRAREEGERDFDRTSNGRIDLSSH